MPEQSLLCPECRRAHAFDGPVPRAALCEKCGAWLRCCLACTHHDPAAYNECREPSAERVVEKASSNFCDYFKGAGDSAGSDIGSGAGAPSALDDLFRK